MKILRYKEDAEIPSFRELLRIWREDIQVNKGIRRPGAQAMVMYRFGVWQRGLRRGIVSALAARFYQLMHVRVRNRYGIELYATAKIGRRLLIGHQSAIVLHRQLVMGDDCIIRQGVTIGHVSNRKSTKKNGQRGPVIGNRVEIGVGAVLVGGILIGDDVLIGPNTVVMRSVPSRSMVTATPARVMSRPPQREAVVVEPFGAGGNEVGGL